MAWNINGAYQRNQFNNLSSNTIIWGKNVQKGRNGNVLLIWSFTLRDTYLFFMRSTTPRKIMTKRRMPAMTPAILTVWSVCFSGSTASGLWVADPGKKQFQNPKSRRPKRDRRRINEAVKLKHTQSTTGINKRHENKMKEPRTARYYRVMLNNGQNIFWKTTEYTVSFPKRRFFNAKRDFLINICVKDSLYFAVFLLIVTVGKPIKPKSYLVRSKRQRKQTG